VPASRRARKGAKRVQKHPQLVKHSRAELRRQQATQRILEAVQAMRSRGVSLTQAAREAGTTPRTVQRLGASALTRKGSRYVARKFDRIPRTMRHITASGLQTVTVKSSRVASRIAAHAAAVNRFLTSGDVSVLWPFEGQTFRVGKAVFAFLTDPTTLEQLAFAGEVSYHDLYALTS
jgi:lambda repressor-like predicted transcriptional regulator